MKELSLIVPIYKKEESVEKSLRGVLTILDQLSLDYEVIAVVDGSPDRSGAIAKTIVHPCLRVLDYAENVGKGNALRTGFALATGRYIGFIDCGLDINPASLVYYTRHLKADYDALIASRKHELTIYNSNSKRSLFTKGFSLARRVLFDLNVYDTQVGLKVFRGDVLKAILPYLQENKWLIDIEILSVLSMAGFNRFKELPVLVNMNIEGEASESSKPGVVLDIFRNLLTLSARVGRLSKVVFWNKAALLQSQLQ